MAANLSEIDWISVRQLFGTLITPHLYIFAPHRSHKGGCSAVEPSHSTAIWFLLDLNPLAKRHILHAAAERAVGWMDIFQNWLPALIWRRWAE
jgi:hypothetical protein